VVSDKNRVTAGVLGILLGWLGIHKFYLGYTQEGTLLLLLTLAGIVLSCVHLGWLFGWIPSVIGLVEGIIYLTKSDEDFQRTYVIGRKPWL
jgi:TM2 domain-containing membrane protein YozV